MLEPEWPELALPLRTHQRSLQEQEQPEQRVPGLAGPEGAQQVPERPRRVAAERPQMGPEPGQEQEQ